VIVLAIVFGGLVVLAIVAVLAAIAIPSFARARQRAQATMTMSHARQIQMAAMRMALDNEVAPDPALGWPGDLAKSPTRPVTSLGDYVERLVEYKYLERGSLPVLFQAPGIPPYTGTAPFDAMYSPFKVYKVRASDPEDCLFLATRNFTYGSGLDPATKPYGAQAGIVCRKDGSAQILRTEPAQKTDLGRLPGNASGGVETAESVLKM
jgi:type II secretory pathway pseudopilin PulG